jgi:hypothetical protein
MINGIKQMNVFGNIQILWRRLRITYWKKCHTTTFAIHALAANMIYYLHHKISSTFKSKMWSTYLVCIMQPHYTTELILLFVHVANIIAINKSNS